MFFKSPFSRTFTVFEEPCLTLQFLREQFYQSGLQGDPDSTAILLIPAVEEVTAFLKIDENQLCYLISLASPSKSLWPFWKLYLEAENLDQLKWNFDQLSRSRKRQFELQDFFIACRINRRIIDFYQLATPTYEMNPDNKMKISRTTLIDSCLKVDSNVLVQIAAVFPDFQESYDTARLASLRVRQINFLFSSTFMSVSDFYKIKDQTATIIAIPWLFHFQEKFDCVINMNVNSCEKLLKKFEAFHNESVILANLRTLLKNETEVDLMIVKLEENGFSIPGFNIEVESTFSNLVYAKWHAIWNFAFSNREEEFYQDLKMSSFQDAFYRSLVSKVKDRIQEIWNQNCADMQVSNVNVLQMDINEITQRVQREAAFNGRYSGNIEFLTNLAVRGVLRNLPKKLV